MDPRAGPVGSGGHHAVIGCMTTASHVRYVELLLARVGASFSGAALDVHVLAYGCASAHRRRLEAVAARQSCAVTLAWHRRPAIRADTGEAAFQAMCWDRLCFLAEEEIAADRILLLDVDLLVEADLLPLWQSDLQGHMLGAVRDFGYPTHGSRFTACAQPAAPYFNTGVLLVDLTAWRGRRGLESALTAWGTDPVDAVTAIADQDALNRGLPDEWLELDPTWNAQMIALQHHARWPESDFKELVRPRLDELYREPRIRHWPGPFKPWTARPGCDIPFEERYRRLLAAHEREWAGGWFHAAGQRWLSWKRSA